MGNPRGDFIWYELLTSNADAAQRFYGELVGWTVSDSGQPGMDYRILDAGDGAAGGMMQINDQMPGVKPIWLGYVGVPDVDAAVEADAAGMQHHAGGYAQGGDFRQHEGGLPGGCGAVGLDQAHRRGARLARKQLDAGRQRIVPFAQRPAHHGQRKALATRQPGRDQLAGADARARVQRARKAHSGGAAGADAG